MFYLNFIYLLPRVLKISCSIYTPPDCHEIKLFHLFLKLYFMFSLTNSTVKFELFLHFVLQYCLVTHSNQPHPSEPFLLISISNNELFESERKKNPLI